MTKLIPRMIWSIGVLALFGTAVLSAQPVTLTATGVNGEYLGPAYTSPYFGTINNGTPIAIICDDFAADTYIGESWQANVTNLASLTGTSPVQWTSGGDGLNEDTAYTVAAYLATEILNPGNTAIQQEELSYALWGLFDGSALTSANLGSDLGAAQNYLKAAVLAVTAPVSGNPLTISNFANVNIYTWNGTACNPTADCNPATGTGPQEFLTVNMAEPSYPTVLALDLAAVAGLMVLFRRRIAGMMN